MKKRSLLIIILLLAIVFSIAYLDFILIFIKEQFNFSLNMKSLDNIQLQNEIFIKENDFLSYPIIIKKGTGELEDIDFNSLKNSASMKITISVAGDATIGSDLSYGYENSFVHEVERQLHNYMYFVENIKPIFEKDDLTLVNLETTFTDSSNKAIKKFTFKGDADYVNILKLADVEAVNIANNHSFDYLTEGFNDTLAVLEEVNIGYFGYEYKYITNINNIKIGVLGYEGWEYKDDLVEQIKEDLDYMNQFVDLTIISFHWGNQNEYYPIKAQKDLAHYAIDNGADLVFGHHPHVIQGIEQYNGRYIVYSLGNFLYGGHRNPADKDTFIFQQTFHFDMNQKLLPINEINIIPFSISSVDYRNNYQPKELEGDEKMRFEEKLNKLSIGIK